MRLLSRPALIPSLCVAALLAAAPARAQLEPQPRPLDEPDAGPAVQPRLTKPPELVAAFDPVYPEVARAALREGDVVLLITIDDEGRVAQVEVRRSAGEDEAGRALDWAALGAATNFEFLPAEWDGVPGPVAIEYRMVFELAEEVVQVPAVEDPDAGPEAPAPVNFAGVVREAATKIPLEGVEVAVEVELPPEARADGGTGIEVLTETTDEEGRFSFRGVPEGRHRVVLTLSGYEPSFVDEDFAPAERTELVVYLQPRETNQFETVVRRKRAQKDVARISLTRDEVRRVPGTFGDPLRVIENLPGLARAPYIGGALIVRGASPQDTGVYFDGVEIPLLYHFGGLTSVVNAEFLEDIEFYPGGFGARYGRATAGIVDVSSRELDLKSFRGYAEVDLIDSGFFFGGPVKIGDAPKVTFAAAARRSYIDALLPFILDAIIGEGGQGIIATPVYWDYQLKLETQPLPGHTFSVFGFGSDDDLRVITQGLGDTSFDLGLHTAFHRLVGRWSWRVGPGVQHRFQPFVGITLTGLSAAQGAGASADFGQVVQTWGARDELTWRVFDGLTLGAGLDYLGSTFDVDVNVPIPVEIGSFPRVFPRVQGENQSFGVDGSRNAIGVWTEAEIEPFSGLKVVPGIRAELTRVSFPEKKLPDGSTSEAADVELFTIDPRVTARLTLLPGTTVKGAVGVYRQAPQGEELNPLLGNPALDSPRAFQVIGGIEQALTDDVNLDVQLYYTHRDLLVQSTGRVRNEGEGEVDPLFYDNGGRGRTFGAEVLLRHEITKYFYGWLAYTLSRTEVDLSERRDRFVLTSFDQTHILTLVGQANLPWGFTTGARFRVVSGNPTSLPLGSVHDLDRSTYDQLGASPRSSRLPTFHQLDVRVDRKWVFEAFSMTTYLDLLNVYNQQNAEAFVSDYRARELAPIPSLPILPVVGVSGEF